MIKLQNKTIEFWKKKKSFYFFWVDVPGRKRKDLLCGHGIGIGGGVGRGRCSLFIGRLISAWPNNNGGGDVFRGGYGGRRRRRRRRGRQSDVPDKA